MVPRPTLVKAPAGRIYNHELHELIFGIICQSLVGNLLLVLVTAPLVVMLATTDPRQSWPMLALLSPLLAPATTAMFAVFRTTNTQEPLAIGALVREFFRNWWRLLPRTLLVGAIGAAIITISALNIQFFMAEPSGALVIPGQVILALFALTGTLLILVALSERPEIPLKSLLKLTGLAVRHWYIIVPVLIVLGLLVTLIAEYPALGLLVAPAPLLYGIWGMYRFALRPILPPAETEEP